MANTLNILNSKDLDQAFLSVVVQIAKAKGANEIKQARISMSSIRVILDKRGAGAIPAEEREYYEDYYSTLRELANKKLRKFVNTYITGQ